MWWYVRPEAGHGHCERGERGEQAVMVMVTVAGDGDGDGTKIGHGTGSAGRWPVQDAQPGRATPLLPPGPAPVLTSPVRRVRARPWWSRAGAWPSATGAAKTARSMAAGGESESARAHGGVEC